MCYRWTTFVTIWSGCCRKSDQRRRSADFGVVPGSDLGGVVPVMLICHESLMDVLAEYEAQDQWRNWEAMLERLPLARGQTVLDLGCGPGLVSVRLATRVANVIGVDRNEEFLSAARQRGPGTCTFLDTNLESLEARHIPLADGL